MLVEIVHRLHNRQTGALQIENPHPILQVGDEVPGVRRWRGKTHQPVYRCPLRLGALIRIAATLLQPHQLPQLLRLEVQFCIALVQSLFPSRQESGIHGNWPVARRPRWVAPPRQGITGLGIAERQPQGLIEKFRLGTRCEGFASKTLERGDLAVHEHVA